MSKVAVRSCRDPLVFARCTLAAAASMAAERSLAMLSVAVGAIGVLILWVVASRRQRS